VLPFKKIYIDTSIFVAAGWPDISAEFEEIISLSRVLKVNVYLLRPVEDELYSHWMRDFERTNQKFKSISSNLNTLLARMSLGVKTSLPSKEEIQAACRERLEYLLRLGLERAEAPPRTVDQLFAMAIWHEKPFQDEGKGFQDAVICLSAIDHFAQSLAKETAHDYEERPGFGGIKREKDFNMAFVSNDRDFEAGSMGNLAAKEGVNLILYQGLEEVGKVLASHLEDAVQKYWEKDRGLALNAVRGELVRIEDFINQNLEIPQRLAFVGDILRVNSVTVRDVLTVHTPLPIKRDEPFGFAAEIKIQIHVSLKAAMFPWPPQNPNLRVGAETTVVESPFFPQPSGEPQKEILDRTVEVELRADDKTYARLEPVSVKLK